MNSSDVPTKTGSVSGSLRMLTGTLNVTRRGRATSGGRRRPKASTSIANSTPRPHAIRNALVCVGFTETGAL